MYRRLPPAPNKKHYKNLDVPNGSASLLLGTTILFSGSLQGRWVASAIAQNLIAQNLIAQDLIAQDLIAQNLIAQDLIAHNVEVAEDVAATFHIEPGHNPRAGEVAQAWFALTRKGGTLIPLQQCKCTLQVYAEPRQSTTQPVLQPPLTPINAERYQNIPGADIVFPKSGIYTLQLSGSPTVKDDFQPFTFTYRVTVAAGTASSSPPPESTNSKSSAQSTAIAMQPIATDSLNLMPWILGAIAGLAGVIMIIWLTKRQT
jgi:hypothetical protein